MDSGLRFIIRSDYAEGRQIQKRIVDEVERHRYCADALFAIKLALEEALINAIKHGNRLDRTKMVHVEADITPQRTLITIEDEGRGFHREWVPDPTATENLERLHGRGILLIESYMDEVEWSQGGRRVRMLRRNAPGLKPGCCP